MDKIDLHLHSTASDGTMSPTEVVAYAKKKNLKAIALTDHDTVDGIAEAIEAGEKYEIEVVAGIELAGDFNNTELHILGYCIDYEDESFKNALEKIKVDRENRNIKIIEKLKVLGFDVSIDELYSIAGGKKIVTRAHFAKLLLKKGYVQTRDEAFKKYISDGCPAYIQRTILNSKQCIELILKAGGIPSLAHPTLYKKTIHEIDLIVKELVVYGLQAIEGIYPLYSKQQTSDIRIIAEKYNIKLSGGSDFHGTNKPDIDLGSGIGNNISVPYKILEDLYNK